MLSLSRKSTGTSLPSGTPSQVCPTCSRKRLRIALSGAQDIGRWKPITVRLGTPDLESACSQEGCGSDEGTLTMKVTPRTVSHP